MTEVEQCNVGLVCSYVPRKCGIATFSHDVARSLAEHIFQKPLGSNGHISITALNDREGSYSYGPEVIAEIGQHRRDHYRNAAELLNDSKIDVVSIQHEYGLFGGEDGDYLLEFLDRVNKPVVSTLHTILSQPSEGQRNVLRRVCEHSSRVVVMADRAVKILEEVYNVPPERIVKIHHGVPDVPFGDREPFKKRFGLAGRPMILTFGLLGPGKGIELMLEAIAKVVPHHPDIAYVILGVTHPGVRRESGESYRLSLESRAVELGIQKNVLFHNRYVSNSDLCEYLQAADLYATPYPAKEQITSGTLAYALASGTAIISTPYWHAQELLADGRGILVDFGDVDGFADAIRSLLAEPEKREQIQKAAYEYGRQMIWAESARKYNTTFREVVGEFSVKAKRLASQRRVLLRMSLPEVRADHMYTMTDSTGFLQHATYSLPDRNHGYSIDDNARSLIVTAMMWSLFQDEAALPYLKTYLSFIHYAKPAGGGRFRNFMSYDRRWYDQDGSDDCQGRVLWALGHLTSHSPTISIKYLATELFQVGFSQVHTLLSPRSWALSLLGLHYFLREYPTDSKAHKHLVELSQKLNNAFAKNETDDWPWIEDAVTYDNGRIPQALIIAGYVLQDQKMVQRGLRALEWLLEIQTGEGGNLSIIGNHGWYRKGNERAEFDQQPLEAAALIGACKAAYRASGDSRWLVEMRRCFEWYLGRNDCGTSLVDFKSRGCFDGLTKDGPNQNQGAESVVSWLISLLTMYEMQTGDAPEIG